jgi:hypothetical protein
MKKIIMGAVATLMTALILGMTTWNFAATQGAVQETEHREVHDNLEGKVDRVQESVDDIKDLILELHVGNSDE